MCMCNVDLVLAVRKVGASSRSEDCETLTGAIFLRRFALEGRAGGGGGRDVGGGFLDDWGVSLYMRAAE